MRSNVKGGFCIVMAFLLGCHPTLCVAAESDVNSCYSNCTCSLLILERVS